MKTIPRTRRWPFLALGAAAFAVVMTLGPIVATRGIDAGGSDDAYAGYNVGMMAARSAVGMAAEQAAAMVPGPVAAAFPEPVAAPATTAPTTTVPPPAVAPARVPEEPQESLPLAPVTTDDEELEISLRLVDEAPADGDRVSWELTVTNEGAEYLWGVYAYVEGIGQIECDARQLDVGGRATCTAKSVVWSGQQLGVAWATAWTVDRMVETFTSVEYVVAR